MVINMYLMDSMFLKEKALPKHPQQRNMIFADEQTREERNRSEIKAKAPMELAKRNTFIFNWVKGYDQETQKLKETFENLELNNRVQIFDHLTRDRLKETVRRLALLNFDLFRYITVVILDNKCKNGHYIQTSDSYDVLIHSEFLTLLKSNKSLASKPRLFVIQKLQDFNDTEEEIDDENGNEKSEVIDRSEFVHSDLKGIQDIYENLEFSLTANEKTHNFRRSPFIDVFCQEFKKSIRMPMPTIASEIRKQSKINYEIDIMFGSNQGRNDHGVLGTALESEELRDFF